MVLPRPHHHLYDPGLSPMIARSRVAAATHSPAMQPVGAVDEIERQVLLQLVGPAQSAEVQATADRWGVTIGETLLACGLVSHLTYARALGEALGVPVLRSMAEVLNAVDPASVRRERPVIIGATEAAPAALRARIARLRSTGQAVALVPAPVMETHEQDVQRHDRLDRAIHQLHRQAPALSAASPVASWQLVLLATLLGLFLGGMLVEPGPTRSGLMTAVAVPFFCVVLFRLLALALAIARPRPLLEPTAPRIADADLPLYSVMVPLFREVAVLPGLIAALSRLDYPAAKLDCILVLESTDIATQIAVRAVALPPFMRVVVVPAGGPQTKPKALNYALPTARGSYVVVYDAEDVPAPSQLRQALAVFRAHAAKAAQTGGTTLACVQARLNIDNANDSWLTRQFTLEYSALFDGLLPALARLGLPVPLGGTSNHFPKAVLEQLGGWDPYNVTEDADVGLRIARAGLAVSMVRSTTWEEAPIAFRPWLYQRTRWMKGWMQTWLVHMREPRRCWRELGTVRFLGAQALMGGMVLSALMHPIFYVALAVECLTGDPLAQPLDGLDRGLWWLAAFNLLAGYSSAMVLAAVTVVRRKRLWLLPHIVLMPVYWVLIALASYRAVWQLMRDPFLWEKTEHRARPLSIRPQHTGAHLAKAKHSRGTS
jgi:glycosyltransferase XagB